MGTVSVSFNTNRTKTTGSGFNGQHGYTLRLANGQCWHLLATEEIWSWLESFAGIMELKPCAPNGNPRLIFRRGPGDARNLQTQKCPESNLREPSPEPDPGISEPVPNDGWKPYPLRSITLWSHPVEPDVLCDIGPGKDPPQSFMNMWQALFPIYRRAHACGGFPAHAALVERDGHGVLLAASGDTGKSTCCRRLPSPWSAVCDDETLIVRDAKNRYRAHPFPTWGDYIRQYDKTTWNVERHVPLSAIFFLEQAKQDQVVSIGQAHTAERIYLSSLQGYRGHYIHMDSVEQRRFRARLFENAADLATTCPAYRLRVSLTGRFWEEMERVLDKEV